MRPYLTRQWLHRMVTCVLALQGKVLRGDGKPEATAFWIHSRLHLKHPLAGCVAHTHQPWATALCCVQDMEYALFFIQMDSLLSSSCTSLEVQSSTGQSLLPAAACMSVYVEMAQSAVIMLVVEQLHVTTIVLNNKPAD